MPGAARATEDAAVGVIETGSENVFVDGKPIARQGDPVADHGLHTGVTIAQGSSTVFANGLPVAREGDEATCGDTISSGSGDVIVGG